MRGDLGKITNRPSRPPRLFQTSYSTGTTDGVWATFNGLKVGEHYRIFGQLEVLIHVAVNDPLLVVTFKSGTAVVCESRVERVLATAASIEYHASLNNVFKAVSGSLTIELSSATIFSHVSGSSPNTRIALIHEPNIVDGGVLV